MEYLVTILRIVAFTNMDDTCIVGERLAQLVEIEEDRFIVWIPSVGSEGKRKGLS
jgi:hypothetical protein